jgi:hypothetical protein
MWKAEYRDKVPNREESTSAAVVSATNLFIHLLGVRYVHGLAWPKQLAFWDRRVCRDFLRTNAVVYYGWDSIFFSQELALWAGLRHWAKGNRGDERNQAQSDNDKEETFHSFSRWAALLRSWLTSKEPAWCRSQWPAQIAPPPPTAGKKAGPAFRAIDRPGHMAALEASSRHKNFYVWSYGTQLSPAWCISVGDRMMPAVPIMTTKMKSLDEIVREQFDAFERKER